MLATDLWARLSLLPDFPTIAESLRVAHIDRVTATGKDSIELGGFQTICVDEAQDVSEAHFTALRALAAKDAEWFLSDSPEQSLFGQRSTFIDTAVDTAKKNGTWERKVANLRSGVAERLVCDAILEIAPRVSEVADRVARHRATLER